MGATVSRVRAAVQASHISDDDTASSRESSPDDIAFSSSPSPSPTPAPVPSPSHPVTPLKQAQKKGRIRSTTLKAMQSATYAAVVRRRKDHEKREVREQEHRNAILRKRGRPLDMQVLSFITRDACQKLLNKHSLPGNLAFARSPTGCRNLRADYMTCTTTTIPLNASNLKPQWLNVKGVDGATWLQLKNWLDSLRTHSRSNCRTVSVRIHEIAARINPANEFSVFSRGSTAPVRYHHSHLCHSAACVLPAHIIIEPQGVNADRTNKACKKNKMCSGHQGGVACIISKGKK